MSVWKRFQRVGKKAAKFQFTATYTELLLETNNFKPSKLVITWLRRNRKYPCEPIKLQQIPSKQNSYSYIWSVPQNQEIQTTLYKMKKEMDFEEKDWTFQIEDIVNGGSRRRLLAYRNVNVSQYADLTPTQNSIKIIFKISSKKVKSATLFLTLSAVFLREGDATDEDMISVASLMSLPSNPSFMAIPSNDVAVLSDLDDLDDSNEPKVDINEKINELCDQIGNLNWDTNKISETNLEKDESFSSQFFKEEVPKLQPSFLSKSSSVKVEYNDDRLYNIAEDDYSINSESNCTSDLLDWCQSITNDYPDVKVTNFTTSFRNGMAFCAIIHHFHPNLIDFDSLKPSNVKENNRIAFTAAGSLGIPKVLDPNEMNFLKIPDSLLVMTYLHQLKTHFTDNNLVLTPASAGNYSKQSPSSLSTSPTEVKNINNINFPTLTDINEETPSTSVQCSPEIKTEKDNVVETQTNSKEPDVSKSPEKPVILQPIPNKSPKKQKKVLSSFNIDGTVKDKWSLSENKIKPVSLGTLNLFSEQDSKENHTNQSPKPTQTNGHPVSPRFSNRLVNEDINTNDNYITAETKALEREQDKIDEEASELEKQIRQVMGKDRKKEAILMDKWFHIVNKKNALIRRNMQLQILEKEQNLELKWNLLQNELRQIISIEDWSKTEEMKRREELLMKDLVNIINQRDKVVKELDEYEQGIGSDLEWARENPDQVSISNIFSKSLAHAKFTDKNCVIQ